MCDFCQFLLDLSIFFFIEFEFEMKIEKFENHQII